MSEPERILKSKSLTTPRAAAVAGILFAILYGTGLVLIRLAIPADSTPRTSFAPARRRPA